MERKTLARGLVVAALACFGFFFAMGSAQAQEGHTVQGTQSSDASEAATGNATGDNSASFNGGPAATGASGASSQQLGDNSASVSQSGSAQSGDPVAGAQIVGAVADNVTVQNQNNATDPVATSGDASFTNTADVELGPTAETDTGVAQAAQTGDNAVDVTQAATVASGDAVAGGQVTGIVGDGEHLVQNQNVADGADALTGDVDVFNDADVFAGPFADSEDEAQAAQVGDNDAVLTQAAEAETGDAVAGSQVTGFVGGSATVQNQNTSDGSTATSGDVDFAVNDGFVATGPVAFSLFESAQSTQSGDNAADVAQDVQASTGDALAGSQVTGAVGDRGGFLTVQNQQASDGDEAFSGFVVEVENFASVDAGASANGETDAQASQIGDNDVAVAQAIDASTGDALAGSQVVGAVGYEDVVVQNQNTADAPLAISGDVEFAANNADVDAGADAFAFFGAAQASQVGDNAVAVDQALAASTGDAVAGGQIVGVVATGSTVEIQNQNTTTDAEAFSGFVGFAENFADVEAGPEAEGDPSSQATQNGDNAVAVAQALDAATGDAVAGAQVTGAVAGSGSDITVQNQNFADSPEAVSGDVVFASNFATVDAGPFAGPAVFFAGADPTATASQIGDNVVAVDQALEATTGDAVAGSQVTGVVAGRGSDVEIQNQNTSIDAIAESGFVVDASNELEANVGPTALAFDVFGDPVGTASASQIGDNELDFAQDIDVASGDAVAGSQVTGVVGPEDALVQVSNTDDGSFAFTGDTDAFNDASGAIGPFADADEASTQQTGDSAFAGSQGLDSGSGDAVAGGQVTGLVGEGDLSASAAAGVGDGAFAVAEAAA